MRSQNRSKPNSDGIRREGPRRLSMGKLKERGWTETLVKQFLGPADASVPNPVMASAPPMRLWNLERIKACEATQAFQEALEQSAKRKDAAQRGVQTKTALTLKLAQEMPINLKKIDLISLAIEARKHYAKGGQRTEPKFKPWGDKDPFRDRLCVNYLRHQATLYHENLDQLFRKTGTNKAYLLLWERITAIICRGYPVLEAEARRQFQERKDRVAQNQNDQK